MIRTIKPMLLEQSAMHRTYDHWKSAAPSQYDREDPRKFAEPCIDDLMEHLEKIDERCHRPSVADLIELCTGGMMPRNHRGPVPGFDYIEANLTNEQFAPVMEALCAAKGMTAEESLATVCREWLAARAKGSAA